MDDSTDFSITLSVLDTSRACSIQRSQVSQGDSNAHTAFLALGKPQLPSAEHIATQHEASRLRTEKAAAIVASDGEGKLAVTLPAHSVCLLQFVPA